MIRLTPRRMGVSLVISPGTHVKRDRIDCGRFGTSRHIDLVDDPLQYHVQPDGSAVVGEKRRYLGRDSLLQCRVEDGDFPLIDI
jgi:hypothetical protein